MILVNTLFFLFLLFRGGKRFAVTGTRMMSVSNPKIQFPGTGTEIYCAVKSESSISCQYPEFSASGPMKMTVIMDGIIKTLNITIKPNPMFNNFTEIKARNKELILDVSYFCLSFILQFIFMVSKTQSARIPIDLATLVGTLNALLHNRLLTVRQS